MAFSQIATSVTIINSGLVGFKGISLTNFSTTAASSIASGSSIEIAGAFFKADADVSFNASSWTAITTATTAYMYLTPSGTAGSQILTASYSSTAPVWSTSKQGWYASAASVARCIGNVYKAGTSSYSAKRLFGQLGQDHGRQVFVASGSFFVTSNIINITGCAAGGNGGPSTTSSSYGGGGGGGGSWANKKPFDTSPGTTINITIGGHAATTTVDTFTLNPGADGAVATVGGAGAGGAGGAIGSGDGAGGAGGRGGQDTGTSTLLHVTQGYSGESTDIAVGGNGGGSANYNTSAASAFYNFYGGGGGGASLKGGGHGSTAYASGVVNKGAYGGGGGGGNYTSSPASGGSAIIILEW